MIPSVNTILSTDFESQDMPSRDYQMLISKERMIGTVTDLDAMSQVIYKILQTERYQHSIYSWDYGIETKDLIGQDKIYVCGELQQRIEDALLQDERIEAVDDFDFDISQKNTVACTFTVSTVFGEVEAGKEVNV